MLPSQHGASGLAVVGEVENCTLDLQHFYHAVYYVISLAKVEQDRLKWVDLCNSSICSEERKILIHW